MLAPRLRIGVAAVRAVRACATPPPQQLRRRGASVSSAAARFPWLRAASAADVAALRALVSPRDSLVDAEALSPFNTDWLRQHVGASRLLLSPRSAAEVSAILAYCHGARLGVVPQGGNTGLVGGGVPLRDEVILSLRRMNRIVAFDAASGVLVAEAGAVLAELEAFLAPHGFAMPLDLGAKGSCQIGGNVATNAGGLRLLRYGSLHGSVLGLEAVAADGAILDSLSRLRKDNVGYDVKQLLIGSEGTLAVITRVAIQAVPRAPRTVALLAARSFGDAARIAALARARLGEVLSAVEFVDGTAMALALATARGAGAGAAAARALPVDMAPPALAATGGGGGGGGGHGDDLATPPIFYVVIETAGSNPAHDREKLDAFLAAGMSEGGEQGGGLPPPVLTGVVASDDAQAAALWALREDVSAALSARGYVYKYDLSFAHGDMYAVVEAARVRVRAALDALAAESRGGGGADAAELRRLAAATLPVGYGHLGDGNVHLNVSSPLPHAVARAAGAGGAGAHDASPAARCHRAMLAALEPWVYEWTMARGGSISAEHGIGQAKAAYMARARPAPVLALMRGIKRLMDPHGILNPGKILEDGGGTPPLAVAATATGA